MSDAKSGEQPAFIAGMRETVAALKGLCAALEGAPGRHGHQPAAKSVAMNDLATEAKYAKRFGDDWLGPVRDTQTLGEITLFAATDYGRCYADLFTAERAPVYGHLVVARAAFEACVISAWLNDPRIETIDRIKRGFCELVYSTWEVDRLRIDVKGAAANREAHSRMATAMGWDVKRNRDKPVVDGTQRPGIAEGITELVLGEADENVGRVQWSYLSSVMHVTWYGLRQSVVEGPPDDVGLGPSIASIGTESKSVNALSTPLES